jgi:DNA mismatch repair protein MutH
VEDEKRRFFTFTSSELFKSPFNNQHLLDGRKTNWDRLLDLHEKTNGKSKRQTERETEYLQLRGKRQSMRSMQEPPERTLN